MQNKVKYVLRPVLLSGCESKSGHCGSIGTSDPLNLGGYGVELALKNMEYKAMDDSAIKEGLVFNRRFFNIILYQQNKIGCFYALVHLCHQNFNEKRQL